VRYGVCGLRAWKQQDLWTCRTVDPWAWFPWAKSNSQSELY